MQDDKFVLLIPALNPNEELIHYVKEMLKESKNCEILVVNDGSNEKHNFIFYEIEKLERCKVLTHKVNLGKGRALKNGINYYINNYSKEEYKSIITVDSDGQHTIKDVLNIAKKISNYMGKILILGSRDFDEKGVPFKSRNGNKITSAVFKLLYGKKINDTQTGLRGLSYDLAKECISLAGERFEYEINMLIYVVNNRIPIMEEKIETIYFNNNSETHFHTVKDSVKIYMTMFKTFFKFIFSSLSSAILDLTLFTVIYNMLSGIEMRILLSTIISRICSSLYNYLINKSVVFKDDKRKITIVKYYILCIVQLCISWLCVDKLYTLVFNTTHPFAIKVVIDFIIFLISYQIQKRWVFKRKKEKNVETNITTSSTF